MEGDADLQFLLVGGELIKIRSNSWKKNRFFKLQEDCKTLWHESHKAFKRNQTCECRYLPGYTRVCVIVYVSKVGFNLHDARKWGSMRFYKT